MAESPGMQGAVNPEPNGEPKSRRHFFEKVGAILAGAVVSLAPLAAGLVMFFDPLRRRKRGAPSEAKPAGAQQGQWVRLATLDQVQADAVPRAFPVIADRWDAWNYYPQEPQGGVYVRRVHAHQKPVAFTARCPHLGCFVEFQEAAHCYKCPCHGSVFSVDGKFVSGVSPRDLDQLEVEIRDGTEIWVKFQKFRAGKKQRMPE